MYYGWSKEFLEAGKKRLAGDTTRAATSDEVKALRRGPCLSKRLWPISRLRTVCSKKYERGWGERGMKPSPSDRVEIIRLVEESHLPARRTLELLGIARSSFYRWYDRYQRGGPEALADRPSRPDRVWNRIPDEMRTRIIEMALDCPELSPRELAVRFTDEKRYFVSEASVYRLLKSQDLITSPAYIVIKAADEFREKTTAPNQLWQTDFTYLWITGWGWYYLSTILDDYSRYIVAWKLCVTMKAQDVTDTLDLALGKSGLDQVNVGHRPQSLSDNGVSYISADLAEWLDDKRIEHIRGAPYHPQTQGKIERWHQTLKRRILLNNYYLPRELEEQISVFVENYNNKRLQESLNNLTPADVYFGRGQAILEERERIKNLTIQNRRLQHQLKAA
jgi:putative transposase